MQRQRVPKDRCVNWIGSITNELSLVPQSIRHALKYVSLLTWKIFIIFQVVVVGRFYSFSRSLPVRHLETGGRGNSHMKRQGMLVGKFEFNSYGRFKWTLPELHYTPKIYRLKRKRFRLLAIVQERIPWALVETVDLTRVIERSAEIKPENRN